MSIYKSGMARLFLFLILGSLALFACNKSNLTTTSFTTGITGKWRYTQTYYSIGGPLIYKSTETENLWVVFNNDGSFASNIPHFSNVVGFEILDSSRVKFIIPSPLSTRLFYFSLDPTMHSLLLSPADFICDEGCGDIFKR
ncbi:MAG: hypothetical protein ABJA57_09005 [Ginsengibacter sp.]